MVKSMTFGQLMLSDLLPEDLYQPGMAVNKKKLSSILGELAKRDPDSYKDVVFKLMRLGLKTGEASGGASFGIQDLKTPPEVKKYQQEIEAQIAGILDETEDGKERKSRILEVLTQARQKMTDVVYDTGKLSSNKFTLQLEGAGRGNKGSFASLHGGDIMVQNASGDNVPVPITRGYSQGQSLGQYLATSYGGRAGIVATKLSVGSSGYLSKLLQQAAHRLVVVDDEDREPVGHDRGLAVDPDDEDNVGAVLARSVGKFEAGTVIKPSMLNGLKKESKGRKILVRSPISSSSLDGGVYAKDVGIREFNRFPKRGEHVGLPSAQSIGEQVTQASLSAKHSAGAASGVSATPGLSGFDLVERLVNPPKEGRGLAAHSQVDGVVKSIKEAPQGGYYVNVSGEDHYVSPEFKATVKVGDRIEAGDVITDGIPDPAEAMRHKGIGEGRRYFVESLRRGLKEAGFPVSRRNLELLARGLNDRVQVDEPFADFQPGSVVSYSRVERLYKPRKDAVVDSPDALHGNYLEVPTAHLTVGTRITPSIAKQLSEVGINQITAHSKPAPFTPRVTRAADILQTDDDFMTRFLGSHLQKSFLDSVYTGAESDENSTSFVPVRASGLSLGRTPLTISKPEEV